MTQEGGEKNRTTRSQQERRKGKRGIEHPSITPSIHEESRRRRKTDKTDRQVGRWEKQASKALISLSILPHPSVSTCLSLPLRLLLSLAHSYHHTAYSYIHRSTHLQRKEVRRNERERVSRKSKGCMHLLSPAPFLPSMPSLVSLSVHA